MKKTLLILLPLLFIVGCSSPEPRNVDELFFSAYNEEYRTENGGELYSGKVFKNYLSGNKRYEGSVKKGKKVGKWTFWSPDAKESSELVFGIEIRGGTHPSGKDGIYTVWYENGQKAEEGTYKKFRKDGLWTVWFENGQKEWEATMKGGTANQKFTYWYKNGHKDVEGAYKDGEWDGKFTTWYENGQKSKEGNYKEGKQDGYPELDGLWTWWHENGQKMYEKKDRLANGWYENGQKDVEIVNYSGGYKCTWWHENGQKECEQIFNDGKWTEVGCWYKYFGKTIPKKEWRDSYGNVDCKHRRNELFGDKGRKKIKRRFGGPEISLSNDRVKNKGIEPKRLNVPLHGVYYNWIE